MDTPLAFVIFEEFLQYLTADLIAVDSSLPSEDLIFSAKFARSTWSIFELVANSLVEYLASETVLYCWSFIIPLMESEKSFSLEGIVFENSARSMSESVVFCPGHFAAQVAV